MDHETNIPHNGMQNEEETSEKTTPWVGLLRYHKSFTAKLLLSDLPVREYYGRGSLFRWGAPNWRVAPSTARPFACISPPTRRSFRAGGIKRAARRRANMKKPRRCSVSRARAGQETPWQKSPKWRQGWGLPKKTPCRSRFRQRLSRRTVFKISSQGVSSA